MVLYTNIDQTLVNPLHVLLNCEVGGLDCDVIYMIHLFCTALVHVIYHGQCPHTILIY